MRDPLDRYYTPPELARACARALGMDLGEVAVIDPYAGGGALLSLGRSPLEGEILGADLDPEAPAVLDGRAALADGDTWRPRVLAERRVWLTNPPFTEIRRRIPGLIERAAAGGALALGVLARLTLLEGLAFLEHRAPSGVWVGQRRPRWEGPGGGQASPDTCTVALLVWVWPRLQLAAEGRSSWTQGPPPLHTLTWDRRPSRRRRG